MSANDPKTRLKGMGLALDRFGDTADRIATDSLDAVTRRNAENVAIVLRHLATAIDAAGVGHLGALEALAQDATATVCNDRFLTAMEDRLAEAVPVFASDEQEGRL